MGLIDQDDPSPAPLLRPAGSPRRARALRKLGLLALAAGLVALVPAESGRLTGGLHRRLRDGTQAATRAIERLAWPAVGGHLRVGLRECRYDWRLRCIPTSARLARTAPVPPARPAAGRAGPAPAPATVEEQAQRAAEAAAPQAAFEDARAAWEADRQAATAYARSAWRQAEPVLAWPGAAAHALRQAGAEGKASIAAVGLVVLVGAAVITLLPFGGWSWLLLPLAVLGVASILARLLWLLGLLLEWPGQLFLLLDVGFTSWRLLDESRRHAPESRGLLGWLRRKPRPAPGPPDLPRWA